MIFVFLIPVLLFLSIEAVSVLFGFTLPSLSVCIQRSSSHIARHVKHQNDAGILPRIVSLFLPFLFEFIPDSSDIMSFW